MQFEQPVVAVEKKNSLAYLEAVFSFQQRGFIVLPYDQGRLAHFPYLTPAETVVPAAGGGWFAGNVADTAPGAMAQISLTSGTTGEPKGILLSHSAMANTTERLIAIMGLDASIREYVGVPVTHSFGFGRVRAICALGGTAFIPDRGFRVDELASMLGKGEINSLSVVPTLARVILDQKARFANVGANLRWIELGSQPMSVEEKQALRALFPNARIVQHYGLTEASRSTFLVISDATNGELASVGEARDGVEVRITAEGRIAVKGPHVAEGQITAEGLQPLVDVDGWLVTGDLGHIEGSHLFFEGRADDVINVGGIKVPADLFEKRLASRLGTSVPIAVAAGEDTLRGQVIVVAHEGKADESLVKAVSEIARDLDVADGAVILPISVIPRTDNGKVQRFLISQTYNNARKATVDAAKGSGATVDVDEPIRKIFVAMFGDRAADNTQSFRSLGGDSLNYVSLLTQLEPLLQLPDDWDRYTIAELSALSCRKTADSAGSEEAIQSAFESIFGSRAREEGASFKSLGGDSLNYVTLLTLLEPHMAEIPNDWDTMSIAALRGIAAEGKPAMTTPAPSRTRHIPANLDTVRTIACVLVVSLHVVGADAGDGLKIPAGSVWHRVMDALDLIRMPLFTAMAGFLYSVMPASRDGFMPFMKRKMDQLLWPLLFATLFYLVVRGLTYGHFDNFVTAYVEGYRHLWYLDVLLLMFAGVALIDTYLKPTPRTWTIVLVSTIIASYLLPDIRILHFKLGLVLFPFFLLGILLHRVPQLLMNEVLPFLAIIVMVAVVGITQFTTDVAQYFPQYSLMWLCGAASVVFFLRLFPRVPLIEGIAAYTFTIYLWHPAANAMVRNLLWKFGLQSSALLFVIGVVVGVGLPILLHKIVIRFPRVISAPIIAR